MIEVTDEMLKVARSMQSFELMIKRIIELHEQSKPKLEPIGYIYPSEYKKALQDKSCCLMFTVPVTNMGTEEESSIALYTTPPAREPLSETIIECIGYRHGLGTLESSLEFTWYNDETVDFARAIEQEHGIGSTNDQPQQYQPSDIL